MDIILSRKRKDVNRMTAKRKKTVEELEKENLALQRQNKELLLKNEM